MMLTLGVLTATSFFAGISMGRVLPSTQEQVEGQIAASELEEFIREYEADMEELERVITEASDGTDTDTDTDYDSDSTIHDSDAFYDASETVSAMGEVDATVEADEEPLNAENPEWAASLLRMAGVFDDDNDNETNDKDASSETWYSRDQGCEAINHAMWESMECISEELQKLQEHNGQLKKNLADTEAEISLLEEELAVVGETSCVALESLADTEAELKAAHEALRELRQDHVGLVQVLVDWKRCSDALAAKEPVAGSTQEKVDDWTAEGDEEDELMSPAWWRRWRELINGAEAASRNRDVMGDFGDYELRRFFHRAGEVPVRVNAFDAMEAFGDYELENFFTRAAGEVNPN
ncbi:hypothetical protein NQ176_g4008 [Zarea fungicola]|uniref:Uncharacterized protein n=1 Tax=Zarea fungicola TaxID=93591 RepID=A0ACC1NFI7_9HYPO|nr:hypothetical protein NQ176_g4008 [Lecanicillium fungicola]